MTVAPALPADALIACTSAWTSGGWLSPAKTIDAPRCARRSFATASANFCVAGAMGAVAPGAGMPSAVAIALATMAIALGRRARRWSARDPVIVGIVSVTYRRF